MTSREYALAGEFAAAAFRAFGPRFAELDYEGRQRLGDEILDAALCDAGIMILEREMPTTHERDGYSIKV